jgi:predicted helicase
MLEENLGLGITRNVEVGEFSHLFCASTLIGLHSISLKEANYLFPLYQYGSDAGELSLGNAGRKANLNPAFVKALSEAVGLPFSIVSKGKKAFTPEDVFYYAYAVFHSPAYREQFADFLKSDFPRLPLPKTSKSFFALKALGEELAAYHLLKPAAFKKLKIQLGGANIETEKTREIAKPKYDEAKKRLYYNAEQYFENVEKAVWEFEIGGYQVLNKWLSDRKGRTLSLDDAETVQKIIIALGETIRLMQEIDTLF